MNLTDKQRLARLTAVFDRGYRIARLYADYLERYPEAITAELVSELTKDGTLSEKEALVAILSEMFALDFDTPEDRIIIRDLLPRSVRVLDAEKYRNNPYYKNIKIDNVKEGSWELRREAYEPYRAFIAGDMESEDFLDTPPLGFFRERFEFPAVLEDGNEWMTLTPVDLDTSEAAIAAARGKVITFGLGLGYYAYMVSEKPEVLSVTVVEKSPSVIALFKKHILPEIPNREKIRIVEADAFEYAEKVMPSERYDLAFVDTWRDASDGLPMYERMKPLENLSPDTEFLYWIEGFIKSRRRSQRFEELLSLVNENSEDAPKSYAEFLEILKTYL